MENIMNSNKDKHKLQKNKMDNKKKSQFDNNDSNVNQKRIHWKQIDFFIIILFKTTNFVYFILLNDSKVNLLITTK